MFSDGIISIDKGMTENIYYQQISQSTQDYIIEKTYIRL